MEVSTVRGGYFGALQNLSRGGTFIETDKIHFIGEEIRLRFRLPSCDIPVEVTGRIRHPYDSRGAGEGVGVEFVDLSGELSAQLAACLESLHPST